MAGKSKFRRWADWVKKHPYPSTLIAVIGVVAAVILIGLVVTAVIHSLLPLIGLVVVIPTIFVIGAAIYNAWNKYFASSNDTQSLSDSSDEDLSEEPLNIDDKPIKVEQKQSPIQERIYSLYAALSASLFPGKKNNLTLADNETGLEVSASWMENKYFQQMDLLNAFHDRMNAFKQFLEVTFLKVSLEIKNTSTPWIETIMHDYSFMLTAEQQEVILKDIPLPQAIENFSKAWQVRNVLVREMNNWCQENEKSYEDEKLRRLKNAHEKFEVLEYEGGNEDSLNPLGLQIESKISFAKTTEQEKDEKYINSYFHSLESMAAQFNNDFHKKFGIDHSGLTLTIVKFADYSITFTLEVFPEALDKILSAAAVNDSKLETIGESNLLNSSKM